MFCKQLGIDCDKLSEEEFVSLINVLKKSSLLKGQPNKRGKNKPKRNKTFVLKQSGWYMVRWLKLFGAASFSMGGKQ